MENTYKKALYQKAIEVWGEEKQMGMVQEEATELALACRKYVRDPSRKRLEDLAEEVADVQIMLEQLKFMHPELPSMIEVEKQRKLLRLDSTLRILKND